MEEGVADLPRTSLFPILEIAGLQREEMKKRREEGEVMISSNTKDDNERKKGQTREREKETHVKPVDLLRPARKAETRRASTARRMSCEDEREEEREVGGKGGRERGELDPFFPWTTNHVSF